MAKISFDDAQKIASTNQFSDIKYFGLKNDGDEALVRIMHDSVEDFEILTVHEVTNANGKKYKVNCLRDINDPLDMCPLCDSGSAQFRRIYVHLIQYTKDPLSGQVTAEPFYWEKPLGFATELKTLITEYGPLSNSLFKIKRNGAGAGAGASVFAPHAHRAKTITSARIRASAFFITFPPFCE